MSMQSFDKNYDKSAHVGVGRPTYAELEARIAELEAENAELKARIHPDIINPPIERLPPYELVADTPPLARHTGGTGSASDANGLIYGRKQTTSCTNGNTYK